MFTFKTNYASYLNCQFAIWEYDNSNLALEIVNGEGSIAICTVNIGLLPENFVAIKNYSENEGMVDFLEGLGLFNRKIGEVKRGFVSIPVFELVDNWEEIVKNINI